MLDKDFETRVKKFIDENKEAFLVTSEFKKLYKDYAGSSSKTQWEWLLKAHEAGSIEYINNAENISECKTTLVKRLEDDHGLSPKVSSVILDMLILFLKNEKIEETKTVETKVIIAKDTSSKEEKSKKKFDSDSFDDYFIKHFQHENIKSEPFKSKDNINISREYNERGYKYNNNGQYDLAIKELNEAIRLDPNNDSAYNNRGHAYIYKGLYEQAINDFNEALRINPNNEAAYNNRVIAINQAQATQNAYLQASYNMMINSLPKVPCDMCRGVGFFPALPQLGIPQMKCTFCDGHGYYILQNGQRFKIPPQY